jgi:60 kDa SS-A/Ro ribonucleoprotein
MAIIPTKQFNRRSNTLSVHQPIPGSAQVENSTGGFTWQVNDWDKLTRFLILGAEGGTYYIGERELVKEGHDAVTRCIKANGVKTVQEIVDVSVKGRAYKNDPAIFALALCAANGDQNTRMEAYAALPKVCRTGTHLYHFMQYSSALRGGTGSGFKRAVARWFTNMDTHKLALQVIKYQQRDGWSARDVLRVAHPRTDDKEKQAIFRWIVGGKEKLAAHTVTRKVKDETHTSNRKSVAKHLPALIEAFEQAKKADEKELIALITEHNLPREAVPTEKLNSVAVWEALLQKMPLTAIIRNLGKMTAIGLLKPMATATKLVESRLADAEHLRKSRVHPMQVLIASKIYGNGHGDKGSLSWTPVPSITEVLDHTFYRTFPNVIPCGKPLLIALDVSGSMTSSMSGPISACEAVAALSLVHASVEKDYHIFGFANTFRELGIRKGQTLREAMKRAQDHNFGSTNIGLAIEYAIENKLEIGGFIIMSDNEVNEGSHSALRLREYRKRFVQDARLVVVGTCSNSFTVNDPNDKFGLDVVGFDASAPPLIADFIRGDKPVASEEAED